MMQPKSILAAAILALSVSVTGCGGGGGGTAIPASPHSGGSGLTPSSANFVISFPTLGSKSTGRIPKYISPNMQSISITETDAGASALAPVVINISTCPATGGTTTCSASVPANPGTDTFAIATFDAAGATGNKLSSGSLSATIVAGQANVTVPVVLGGIVASLKLTLGDAFAPIGTATTLAIAALDASGATIIGTYDNPVTASAGTGATLSQSTFTNSSDATKVNVSYVGEPAAPVTISASGDGHTGTATLTPGSGYKFYALGTNQQYDGGGFQITAGTDGKLYYGTLGALTCSSGFCTGKFGSVGQIDPATGNFVEANLASSIIGVFQTPDGAVWAAENSAGKIARFAPGTFPAAPTEVLLPNGCGGGCTARPRSFALAPDGSLWFSDANAGRLGKIVTTGTFSATSITMYTLPVPTGPGIGNFFSHPNAQGVAFGSDGDLYVAEYNAGVIAKVDPATGNVIATYTLPYQLANGPNLGSFPRFITSASDGNLYITEGTQGFNTPFNGGLLQMSTSGAFQTIGLPSAAYVYEPDSITSKAGVIAWADLQNGSIGFGDFVKRTLREVPMGDSFSAQVDGRGANGVAFAPDGSVWAMCYGQTGTQPVCAAHLVLNSTWSVMPSRTINIYGTGRQASEYMGIAESGDSGPFTVTSANPAIASASNISDHNFEIDGSAPGSTTLTVTDAHGRSVTVAVNVTTTSGSVTSTKRNSGGNI